MLFRSGLAVACLGAPAPVQASCGDYVVIGSSHDRAAPDAGSMATPAHQSGTMPMKHGAPGRPGKPCSGPGCSRHHPTPAPAPVTAPTLDDERWGHDALAFLLPGAEPGPLCLSLPSPRPIRGGCSVYHPPAEPGPFRPDPSRAVENCPARARRALPALR